MTLPTQSDAKCGCGRPTFGDLLCRVCRLYDAITLGKGPRDA